MPAKLPMIPDVAYVARLHWFAEQNRNRLQEMQEEERKRQQEEVADSAWRLYYNDPLAWVHDMIDWREGEGPAAYQDEILAELPIRKRVCVRAPHGAGKSALNAWVILWYALTRDGADWKIPTLASVWRQLKIYLWPEVRKWARRLRWDKLGRAPFDFRSELLMMQLRLKTGEAFALASDVPDSLEGAHADKLCAIFDESKSIPDATFDALEGAMSGTGEVYALAQSTPGDPKGRFYDIQRRRTGTEDWWARHITKDELIAAGRMSPEWAEQRRRLWGAQSAVYLNRVEGEFAANDEDSIIPLAWVEAAVDRWREMFRDDGVLWEDAPDLPEFTAVGVDVGTGSAKADKTTLALRHDWILHEIRKYQHADTMQTAGRVKGILDAYGGRAIVDVIGIGAGTVDRLKEQRCNVYGFVAGAASKDRRGKPKRDRSGELVYGNNRAEAWWSMRERLDPSSGDEIALPPDDDLIGDLTAPKYRVVSGGRIVVESKDELRKPDRLGRSTDTADAVVQAFWEPEEPKRLPSVGPAQMEADESESWLRQ